MSIETAKPSFKTDKAIERSVDSIQKIYAVVIALAIAQSVQSLLKEPKPSWSWSSFCSFLNNSWSNGSSRNISRLLMNSAFRDACPRSVFVECFASFFDILFLVFCRSVEQRLSQSPLCSRDHIVSKLRSLPSASGALLNSFPEHRSNFAGFSATVSAAREPAHLTSQGFQSNIYY